MPDLDWLEEMGLSEGGNLSLWRLITENSNVKCVQMVREKCSQSPLPPALVVLGIYQFGELGSFQIVGVFESNIFDPHYCIQNKGCKKKSRAPNFSIDCSVTPQLTATQNPLLPADPTTNPILCSQPPSTADKIRDILSDVKAGLAGFAIGLIVAGVVVIIAAIAIHIHRKKRKTKSPVDPICM